MSRAAGAAVRSRPPLPPAPWLVVGLARSGAAAVRMLAPHGRVLAVDSGRPAEAQALSGEAEVQVESDGIELLGEVRTVVKSPGVPHEAPVIAAARERGLEVVGELEVAWRLVPNAFIAVTGTNGKTTTAELLGAIFRASGRPVAVAGNVGAPVGSLVGAIDRAAVVVCEASSFQLEDSRCFRPEVAVLLNLEPDHLDRHATVEAYRAAKMRVFTNQLEEDWAVLPPGMHPPGRARVVHYDAAEAGIGPDEVRLPGAHNLENAAAAAVAARVWGVEETAVREALRTFPGVPNRLEEVTRRGGVAFVNDSKATNVASAVVGIRAFERGVHAILGGSLKGGDFRGLREPIQERCTACYLIGGAAGRLAADLRDTVPLQHCGDLAAAVGAASRAARPGEVVLLSPACASYDQYPDYEARGEHFRGLVRELPTDPEAGPVEPSPA